VVDASGNSIVLIGDAPAVVGERLVLDVQGPSAQASLPVRVESSKAVVIDGTVRHEIRVTLTHVETRAAMLEPSGDPVDDEAAL
jgi:hypothetical protein